MPSKVMQTIIDELSKSQPFIEIKSRTFVAIGRVTAVYPENNTVDIEFENPSTNRLARSPRVRLAYFNGIHSYPYIGAPVLVIVPNGDLLNPIVSMLVQSKDYKVPLLGSNIPSFYRR